MPKIQEYQTRTSAQTGAPQGRKISTEQFNPGAQIDAGIRGVGAAASVMLQSQEQQDVSSLHVALAKVHEESALEMNDQVQKGTFKFDDHKKSFEDKLANVREQVASPGGQRFFDQQSATMHAENMITAAKAQMTLVGEKSVEDQISATNSLANSVRSNPSSGNAAVAMSDSAIDAKVAAGLLPYQHGVIMKRQASEQIKKAEMESWAQVSTTKAKQLLDSGAMDHYLGKDVKDEMYGKIKMYESANRQEEERRRIEKERAVRDQQDATKSEFINKMLAAPVNNRDIAASNLDPEDKVRYLSLNNKVIENKETASYGTNFQSLLARIHADDNDLNKIRDEKPLVDEAIKGNLTMPDLKTLRDEIAGKKTPQGQMETALKAQLLKVAKAQLNPTNDFTGIPDPVGETRMQAWLAYSLPEYQKQLQAGKTPTQLLTPPMPGAPNPDYLGHKIPMFAATSFQENISNMSKRYNTSIPGLVQPGNIDLTNRPQVKNPETGEISTVWSMGIGTDDGKEILIPRVSDDGRILSEEEAKAQYKQTGKHLGIFKDVKAATAYGQQLSAEQKKMLSQPKKSGETPVQYLQRIRGAQ